MCVGISFILQSYLYIYFFFVFLLLIVQKLTDLPMNVTNVLFFPGIEFVYSDTIVLCITPISFSVIHHINNFMMYLGKETRCFYIYISQDHNY